jgi:serine/threonine-protein kinase HipA
MMRQLEVWLFDIHIGTLSQAEGRVAFSYSKQWLESAEARPLSHSLPLAEKTYNDQESRPFFAGLLPEGDNRKHIAQALQVSTQNDFALLDGIGGECAGAISLLDSDDFPQSLDEGQHVRWLDDSELLTLLEELPKRPMLVGEEGLRLSLA